MTARDWKLLMHSQILRHMSFLHRFKSPDSDGGAPREAAEPTLAPARNGGGSPNFKSPVKKAPDAPPAPVPPRPAAVERKHEIQLELGEFLPRIPKQLLHDGPHDVRARLVFDIGDLADRITRGQTTIPLPEIHRRAPEIFREEILASDETEIRFPWQTVMRMLADARTTPSAALQADGLSQAAAESLVQEVRNRRAVRNIVPIKTGVSSAPHPRPSAPAPVAKAEPAPLATVVPAGAPQVQPDSQDGAADGALAMSAMTVGATLDYPLQDADKLSREELLRSREAMRAQFARAKGNFERQLTAIAQERKNLAEERERLVAEMVRAKAEADDRIEQIEFEKIVAAKTAANLTQAQQAAKALQGKLTALKSEAAKASEADQRIQDLVAERDCLAQRQAEAVHALKEAQEQIEAAGAVRSRLAAELEKARVRLAAGPTAGAALDVWDSRAADQFEADIESYRERIKRLLAERDTLAREKAALAAQLAAATAPPPFAPAPAAKKNPATLATAVPALAPRILPAKRVGAADGADARSALRSYFLLLRGKVRNFQTGAVILAVLATGWILWTHNLRTRIEILQTGVERFESELATLSVQARQAAPTQPQFNLVLKEPRRVAEEMGAKGWTPALRVILGSLGPDVELHGVGASRAADDPQASILHIQGIATGVAPRMIADHFRERLQRELERQFHGGVTARFEQLEDKPVLPSTPADKQKTIFAIGTTIGRAEKVEPGIQPEA